jgi:hypothetical protein
MPRGLVCTFKRFGWSYHPDDGGDVCLQNATIYIQVHMTLQSRRSILMVHYAVFVVSC